MVRVRVKAGLELDFRFTGGWILKLKKVYKPSKYMYIAMNQY